MWDEDDSNADLLAAGAGAGGPKSHKEVQTYIEVAPKATQTGTEIEEGGSRRPMMKVVDLDDDDRSRTAKIQPECLACLYCFACEGTQVHKYLYTCMHAHAHACIHAQVRAHLHCMCMCVHAYIFTRAREPFVHEACWEACWAAKCVAPGL